MSFVMRHSVLSDAELTSAIVDTGEIDMNSERVFRNGLKSPVYVDGRGFISHPHVLYHIGQRFSQTLGELTFDIIAGIPMAGLSLAQATSTAALTVLGREVPAIWVRENQKDYGTGKAIEGRFEKGQTCVAFDNVVTDGESKIDFAKLLKRYEIILTDCIVLVDHEQGGREKLASAGINLHAIYTISPLCDMCAEAGKVTPERYRVIKDYLADPLSFANNREIDARRRTADTIKKINEDR